MVHELRQQLEILKCSLKACEDQLSEALFLLEVVCFPECEKPAKHTKEFESDEAPSDAKLNYQRLGLRSKSHSNNTHNKTDNASKNNRHI